MNELLKAVSQNWVISNAKILSALAAVPREKFAPSNLQSEALADKCVVMPGGYSISQPGLVATMIDHLKLTPESIVLDVGSGSGYHAALMSRLCQKVYGIERLSHAVERSNSVLKELNFSNIELVVGDRFAGLPEKGPFDAINIACAVTKIPLPLVRQLKVGGRMILPYGPNCIDPAKQQQKLVLIEKLKEGLNQGGSAYSPFLKITELFPVQFMLMTSDKLSEEASGLDSTGGKV